MLSFLDLDLDLFLDLFLDLDLDSSVFPVLRPSRVDLPRDPGVVELQARLGELKLSNKAIEDRETDRIAATKAFLEDEARKGVRDAGYILRSQTPWFVMVPYKVLCWFLGERDMGGGGREEAGQIVSNRGFVEEPAGSGVCVW